MKLLLHILPAAEQDLSEIGDYFDVHSESLSYRFYERFLDSARTLARSPELGERYPFCHPELEEMRVWRVSGFSNYLIFYRRKGDNLEILRVLHGARDYAALFNEE